MDLFMVPSNLLFWLAFYFMCFQPKTLSWRINCRNIQLESCKFNWLEPNISNISRKNEQKPGDSPNSPNSTIQLGWPAGYQAVSGCFQPLLRSMISWNVKAWRNTPRRSLKSQMLLGSIGWSQKGGRFLGPNSWWSQVFKRLELGFWDI